MTDREREEGFRYLKGLGFGYMQACQILAIKELYLVGQDWSKLKPDDSAPVY